MSYTIYDRFELAELLVQNTPPPGWKVEVGLRRSASDPEAVEVAVSAPMTFSSHIEWGPEWPLVKVWRYEPQNLPYYPEHYGDTPDEALETLCEHVAEEWWPEVVRLTA